MGNLLLACVTMDGGDCKQADQSPAPAECAALHTAQPAQSLCTGLRWSGSYLVAAPHLFTCGGVASEVSTVSLRPKIGFIGPVPRQERSAGPVVLTC